MPVCLSIDLPEDAQVHSARPCILEEASSTTSLEIEKFPMVDLELEDLEMAARAQYSMKASVDGYPAVADCIIRDPDDELFVFRKFRWLSARKLLHLESELMVLEQELRGLDQEALVSSKISLQKSRRNWEQFAKNALETSGQSGDKKRMEVMEKIDVKLERYRKPNLISLDHALQLQGNILKFESPSKRVLTALRNDFFGLPGNKCLLAGTAELMFEDSEDLAVLKGPTDKDTLSRLLRDHWVFSTTGDSNHGPSQRSSTTRHFSQRHLTLVFNICSNAIAATLLIGSTLALYFVTNPDARLALVIGFILLFAAGLSFATNANRDSIFAATAAYAAVLVVFVSGNLGHAATGG